MLQLFPPAQGRPTTPADDGAPEDSSPILVDDIDVAIAAENRRRDGGPWLYTNMVTSLDGGTAIDGVSGGLGNDGDRQVFAGLRSAADAILVGSGTARDESYKPPRRPEPVRQRRIALGRRPDPELVVVSASLSVEPDLPMFSDPGNRPVILTCRSSPAEKRDRLAEVAEVIISGGETVDLAEGLAALGDRGHENVLGEGGPSLNGQLAALDLIDEWNLTVSPRLLAGESRRAAIGPLPEGPPPGLRLARVWTDEDFLYCRWVRP